MSEVCLQNKRIFSVLHGIPFVLGSDTPQTLKLGLSPRLLKIYWILKLLRRGVRRIMYTDLDTVFTSRSSEIINTLYTMNASIALSPDWRKPVPPKRRTKKYKFAIDSSERIYDDSRNARLNTGVLFIKNTPVIRQLFETIFREGLLQPQADVSDQRLLNKHIWRMLDSSEIALIDRVRFNAFPVITDSRYRSMGLPVGDEDRKSLLVHFAGI
jgi:lipopolysaccharide biosynthesis glycosyltransferase